MRMLRRSLLLSELHSGSAKTIRCSSRFQPRRSWLSSPAVSTRLGHRYLVTQSDSSPTFQPRQRRKDIVPTPDTIYALSTASGRAAIAIIRISGPACLDIYGGLCPDKAFPFPRHATLRKLVDPTDTSRIIDKGALLLYFPAPATVTGEDVLELHVHGGPAVVRSVLEAIPKCTDTRPRRRTAEYSFIRAAEAGEFTKRAFYNNRIDLTQAEALGEILAAETEQQRKLAIAGSGTGLSLQYESWRTSLLNARGELEALIDFSEDQHFEESPAEFTKSVSTQVEHLRRQVELYIKNATRGELLRNGISVALIGAPNAGKSSLLNRIVGREAAIVSNEAGTTRDIVDVSIDLGGWLVRLGDMAGLRAGKIDVANNTSESIGIVEQEGIRRARERAMQSDVVIVLISLVETDSSFGLEINSELLDAVQECRDAGKVIIFAVNKVDLIPHEKQAVLKASLQQGLISKFPSANPSNIFFISCKDASTDTSPISNLRNFDLGGIQSFLAGLMSTFSSMTTVLEGDNMPVSQQQSSSYWSASLSVTHRQRAYLEECLDHLNNYLAQVTPVYDNKNTFPEPIDIAPQFSHHIDGHDDLVGEVSRIESSLPPSIATLSHTDAKRSTSADTLACLSASPTSPININSSQLITRFNTSESITNTATFDIVTAAEHLRYAADCLASITGRFGGGDVEDVLGVVFER